MYCEQEKDKNVDKVIIMTVHSAKGLEYDYVFVVSLSDGNFPSKRALLAKDLEEERRIFYVACTRAKKMLFLSGSPMTQFPFAKAPSRFLIELNKKLFESSSQLPKGFWKEAVETVGSCQCKTNSSANTFDFKTGETVNHDIMGKGIIEEIDENSGYGTVQFKLPYGKKKINLAILHKVISH